MQFRIEWRFLKIWLKIYERILFTKRLKLNEINEEWCDDLWKIIILLHKINNGTFVKI